MKTETTPKTDPNHAAQPYVQLDGRGEAGLTKREYFAAMAMQGILANDTHSRSMAEIAKEAVIMANSLIKELNSLL
ncbi:hypothetical protein D3C71_343910 [compost metagenome]